MSYLELGNALEFIDKCDFVVADSTIDICVRAGLDASTAVFSYLTFITSWVSLFGRHFGP